VVQLDLLRGCAILLVLVHHSFSLDLPQPALEELQVFTPLIRMGDIGVPIFFVLSGYLIGGLMLKEASETGKLDPVRFLFRRAFKIYPPFYAVIIVYSAYLILFENGMDLERLLREIFFLQNYGAGGLIDVSWSLAVEEHFYLSFAAIAFLMVSRSRPVDNAFGIVFATKAFRLLPWLALSLMLVTWIWRCTEFLPMSDSEIAKRTPTLETHFRIDALFAGAALAWFQVARPRPGWIDRYQPVFLLAAITILGLSALPSGIFPHQIRKTHYLVLLTGASATVLWVLLGHTVKNRPLWRVLGLIGRHSYCIYLVHIPAYRLLNRLLGGPPDQCPTLIYVALAWLTAIFAGICMTKAIEEPALQLREHWFPRRSSISS